MGTPHKHADVIKAWADGADVQYKIGSSDKWEDTPVPEWFQTVEYRIKPQTLKYRVALTKRGAYYTPFFARNDAEAKAIESWQDFDRWLPDWIEVEV